MAQYIYTMNRVAKVVPPKRHIIRDISLSFFPGAKIGVLGLNGSGKSTLMRIMAGLDTEIDGEARPQPGIKIGYLPQEPELDPDKDVRGNVEEGLGEVIDTCIASTKSAKSSPSRCRRRNERSARRTGQAAGCHRLGRRLGNRSQTRGCG